MKSLKSLALVFAAAVIALGVNAQGAEKKEVKAAAKTEAKKEAKKVEAKADAKKGEAKKEAPKK